MNTACLFCLHNRILMIMRFMRYSSKTLSVSALAILLMACAILRPSWQIGGDGYGYYAYVRSLVFDGDLDFTNEWLYFDHTFGGHMGDQWRTPLGRAGNPFPVGPALLWSPFLFAAHAAQLLFGFNDPYPIPGYNVPYQLAIGIGTWVYALAGLVLIFRALRMQFSPAVSWWSTLTVLLISPLPYYLIYEPSMSHGLTIFSCGLLLFLTAEIITRPEPKPLPLSALAFIGFSLALAFLLRWQDALYGIIPLSALIAHQHARMRQPLQVEYFNGRKNIQRVAVAGIFWASFFIIALPQFAVWKHLYGTWIALPQGAGFFELNAPNFSDFLFSGFHGMFITHPLLLAGVLGIIFSVSKKKLRMFAILSLIALALQIYLNAGLADWFGGASFGARRMVSALPFLAFGFAYAFDRIVSSHFTAPTKRIIIFMVSIIIVAGILFNFSLMAAYARGILSLEKTTTREEIFRAPFAALRPATMKP